MLRISVATILLWWLILPPSMATGQALDRQHRHPPQDADLHARFYSTWLRPNGGKPRQGSCCNMEDCYPATFAWRNGRYYVQRREDGAWLPVPAETFEHRQPDPRESPDGRSHVYTPKPGTGQAGQVFCAVLGNAM